ncbi:MAG: HAMP domain-containing histidine kinase [Gemmatimonadaceae bacterium]|nr:HAMP domain-containing histidine kinase [Gemmatimonadaceae bacterium]
MNAAVLLSACVAILQLAMAVLFIAVARAPGWRQARTFALIATSAAAYSAGNIGASWHPMADPIRRVLATVSYVAAGIFAAGWLVFAFGGSDGRVREMPRWARALALASLGGAAISITTLQLSSDTWVDITVDWATLHYRFPAPNPLGSAITYVYLFVVVCVCMDLWRPRPAGERTWEYRVGFSIFFLATAVEVLITNGVLRFFFVADVGFLAVVIPMAAATVRRFIADARRLSSLSTQLTMEVELRTQERDEAHHAWIEAERQASLGRLAAGVGHEINNPLAYLRLNLELMGEWGRDHAAPTELLESVESALDGADRIRRVVDALRASTRPGAGVFSPVSLEEVTQSALRVAAHQLRGVAIDVDLSDAPTVLGDEPRLVQAMVNLLLNASQSVRQRWTNADESQAAPRIRVQVATDREGRAALTVADNGAGISREELRRLMQPYFSTRGGAEGIGFGLFLARGVFEQHGGVVDVESNPGTGTQVRVRLPSALERQASALQPLQPLAASVGGGRHTIEAAGDAGETAARGASVAH